MIMASEISDKAVVSPKAKIGDGCKIYPFVYIEDDVEIGDNCIIYPFVSVLCGTRMGNGNRVLCWLLFHKTSTSWASVHNSSSAIIISFVRMWSSTVPPMLVDRR